MKRKLIFILFLLSFSSLFSQPDNKEVEERWYPIFSGPEELTPYGFWGMHEAILDSLNAVFLINVNFNCPQVYATQDGGKTFEERYSEFWPVPTSKLHQKPKVISYPIKNHVYFSIYGGQLRYSKDDGYTYDTIFIPNKADAELYRVSSVTMYDTLLGVGTATLKREDASTWTHVVLITEDNWKTFKCINIDRIFGTPFDIQSRFFHWFTSNHFSFVEHNNDWFVYTEDRGKTWNYFDFREAYKAKGIEPIGIINIFRYNFLKDNKHGWAAARERNNKGDQSIDVIFQTKDGGKTWELNYRQENEPVFGLSNVAFCDTLNGTAVGYSGKILRTTDGGKTWEQEYGENHWHTLDHSFCMDVFYLGNRPIISSPGVGPTYWTLKDEYLPKSIKQEFWLPIAVSISPNPANTSFTLSCKFSTYIHNLSISIFDLEGRKIKEIYSGSVPLGDFIQLFDISSLPSGFYKVIMEYDGKKQIQKLIIAR